MSDETKKTSMKMVTWAVMTNMPLRLKAEITIKMLLAGSEEKKCREMSDGSIAVTHPYECVMLCIGCEGRCPEGAISFPDRNDFYRYVYYV
jgi:NAD-dependent dihydropyrimidine dehydrogenase PreA subunit